MGRLGGVEAKGKFLTPRTRNRNSDPKDKKPMIGLTKSEAPIKTFLHTRAMEWQPDVAKSADPEYEDDDAIYRYEDIGFIGFDL